MDISKLKNISDPIHLARVSPAFAALEGQTDQPAYVVVRKAIEEDNITLAELVTPHELYYPDTSLVERISANEREMRKHQVYLTLQDAGNLTRDGYPAFPVLPIRDMPFEAFEWVWLALRDEVASAIIEAMLTANPSWR